MYRFIVSICPTLAVTLLAAPAVTAALVSPALADETTGTVVAHDRVAHRVIMNDRSIYQYDPAKTTLPRAILAGDKVKVVYRGGEDGIESISSIEIVTPAD